MKTTRKRTRPDYSEDYALITRAQAGDVGARNDLIVKYRGFIYDQVRASTPAHADHTEFFVDGLVAFVRCIDAFKVESGVSIIAPAKVAIRNELLRQANRAQLIALRCYGSSHPSPTRYEAGERAKRVRYVGDRTAVLDATRSSRGTAWRHNEHDSTEAAEHIGSVLRVIDRLPARQREVLNARMRGITLRKLAEEMGVTFEAVRLVEKRALKNCREMLGVEHDAA